MWMKENRGGYNRSQRIGDGATDASAVAAKVAPACAKVAKIDAV